MVRKRSHRRYSKIESDESDSDDFYEEDLHKETPKKYSLRQRKGASFAEDPDPFSHAQPEENTQAATSNDEPEVQLPKSPMKPQHQRPANPTVTLQELKFEPEVSATQHDGLIDFEDVIRADILVNTNKIDFEDMIDQNAINKRIDAPAEEPSRSVEVPSRSITQEPSEKKLKLKKNGETPKKRGRKPKKQTEELCQMTDQYDSTGLPINSVLGVSESLYELAERYMQAGPNEQLAQSDSGNSYLLTEGEAASEPIETF